MEADFQIFLILLAVLAGTTLLARRVDIAPAILLLLAGTALAFVPGMPPLELPPELVLLAGVAAADLFGGRRDELARIQIQPASHQPARGRLRDLHRVRGRRGHALPHRAAWNVGFLLGAVVAPTDVVAPLAIARKLGIPRRILVVLEGEGLANDATALDPLSLHGGGNLHRGVFAAEGGG